LITTFRERSRTTCGFSLSRQFRRDWRQRLGRGRYRGVDLKRISCLRVGCERSLLPSPFSRLNVQHASTYGDVSIMIMTIKVFLPFHLWLPRVRTPSFRLFLHRSFSLSLSLSLSPIILLSISNYHGVRGRLRNLFGHTTHRETVRYLVYYQLSLLYITHVWTGGNPSTQTCADVLDRSRNLVRTLCDSPLDTFFNF